MLKAKFEGIDIKDSFKSFDMGLVLGSNTDVMISEKIKFFLDGRYTLGLFDYEKLNDNWKMKNGVLSISVGFIFPIGLQ